MMQWQFRDYEIAAGRLDDFVKPWTSGVLPLRRAVGFEIRAWTVAGESRFVWLLEYDGPETFEAADEAYYESPARAALEPDPAQWIVASRKVMLEAVVGTAEGAPTLRP